MSEFDADEFCDWLDEQESPIAEYVVSKKFPNFPWDYVVGVTATFVDEDGQTITDLEEHEGEVYMGYYKRDLRRAAKRSYPID